jgi:hypothetical protein
MLVPKATSREASYSSGPAIRCSHVQLVLEIVYLTCTNAANIARMGMWRLDVYERYLSTGALLSVGLNLVHAFGGFSGVVLPNE